MRLLATFAAAALITAPIAVPAPAFADGIERPRRAQPRPRPRPQLEGAPAPAPVIPAGPETVTLSEGFFASGGGVGADIGVNFVGGGTTIIVAGSRASASAFASARAFSRAGNGFRGGGHGCGGCR